MKHGNKRRGLYAILLAAVMLLPSCGKEAPKPADTSDSSEIPAQSSAGNASDLPSEAPFCTLSEEEAAALFGEAYPDSSDRLDPAYYYFSGSYGTGGFATVYRYHYATGGVELACQKPGCDHMDESCPFYGGMSYVLNGKLFRVRGGEFIGTTTDENGWVGPVYSDQRIVRYDLQTNESKEFPSVAGADTRIHCATAGNSFYYTLENVYDAETDSSHPEAWKITEDGEGPTLVLRGTDSDEDIFPCLVDGKECLVVQSYIGPDGESLYTDILHQRQVWLYLVESGSEERKLLYDKPVKYVDRIDFELIVGGYAVFVEDEPHETDEIPPRTFHFLNLSTGEDIIFAEHMKDVKLAQLEFTDQCFLYLREDPTETYNLILCCYDTRTGGTKEYPLNYSPGGSRVKTDGIGGFSYRHGQIFMHGPGLKGKNGKAYTIIDLVVWDIATGAMRSVYFGKILPG